MKTLILAFLLTVSLSAFAHEKEYPCPVPDMSIYYYGPHCEVTGWEKGTKRYYRCIDMMEFAILGKPLPEEEDN